MLALPPGFASVLRALNPGAHAVGARLEGAGKSGGDKLIAQDRHWTLEIGGPGGGLIGDWRLVRGDWRLEAGHQEVFFIRGAESRTAGADSARNS